MAHCRTPSVTPDKEARRCLAGRLLPLGAHNAQFVAASPPLCVSKITGHLYRWCLDMNAACVSRACSRGSRVHNIRVEVEFYGCCSEGCEMTPFSGAFTTLMSAKYASCAQNNQRFLEFYSWAPFYFFQKNRNLHSHSEEALTSVSSDSQ